MGIRPDDVQYIELYNEYNKLQTNGEKVSYIVATLSLRYGISERKVYDLITLQFVCSVIRTSSH